MRSLRFLVLEYDTTGDSAMYSLVLGSMYTKHYHLGLIKRNAEDNPVLRSSGDIHQSVGDVTGDLV